MIGRAGAIERAIKNNEVKNYSMWWYMHSEKSGWTIVQTVSGVSRDGVTVITLGRDMQYTLGKMPGVFSGPIEEPQKGSPEITSERMRRVKAEREAFIMAGRFADELNRRMVAEIELRLLKEKLQTKEDRA